MTMKNVPITLGFAAITASQFALGMTMTILSGRKGGRARLLNPGDIPFTHLPLSPQFRPCSIGAPIDTSRLVHPVRILPAQKGGGRVYNCLALLRYVRITFNQKRAVLTPRKCSQIRHSRVLVDRLLGGSRELEEVGIEDSTDFANNCGRCDAVLRGYIYHSPLI